MSPRVRRRLRIVGWSLLAGPKRLMIIPGAGHGGFVQAQRSHWREAPPVAEVAS